MVDQAARDIYRAGSDIADFFQNQQYLNLSKKRDQRAQTLFEQQQKEREKQIMARKVVENEYLSSGVVDEDGNITNYQAFTNPQAGDKSVALKTLKDKGTDAFSYLKANTEFTGQLLSNEKNLKNLSMLAIDKANTSYNNIEEKLGAADIEMKRGNRKAAATYMASAIQDSIVRVHAKAKGDKIEVWEVVNGERQKPQTMKLEDAFALAQEYTRENYAQQASAHIIAGYENNKNPKTFELKSPDGKSELRAMQVFKSSGVDYLFFNKDGSVAENAPKDLEQAYKSGWTPITAKGQQQAADLERTKQETLGLKGRERRAEKKFKLEKTGRVSGKKADAARKERLKYGEKRYTAIKKTMDTWDEMNPPGKENLKEYKAERQKVKRKAEVEFNEGVMGWQQAKEKKTGRMAWYVPGEDKMVDDYGRPLKIAADTSKSPKLTTEERKKLISITRQLKKQNVPENVRENNVDYGKLLLAGARLSLRNWRFQPKAKKEAQLKEISKLAKKIGLTKEDWKATGKLYKEIGGWAWDSYNNVLNALFGGETGKKRGRGVTGTWEKP